ncbi:hypothetical protein Taro_031157 [Colocasia esculenta]|uniref:Protein SHORTAGE IN CHIASMATA 1 n=1 Tax=Colocasia esculenta TaxID=4460 RepID=A0A843VI54_COLES|nr:hypothetical protein [Colocasia esculenta]
MRTRYLSMDYFFAGCSGEALRGFTFLSLPTPSLPTPRVPCAEGIFSGDFDLCFDSADAPAIDAFPVDGALARFLSDVVPKFYSAGEGESSEIASSSERTLMRRSEADQIVGLEADRSVSGRRRKEPYEAFQFEIIETGFLQKECMSTPETDQDITLRIQGLGISLDMVSTELANSLPYLHEVVDPIFLVENIPTRSSADEAGFYSGGDSSLSDGSVVHFGGLLKFEVFESSLKLDECLCSNVFSSLIPHVKNWLDVQGDGIKESLESIYYDVLEYSSVKPLSEEVPGFEAVSLDSIVDMDILTLNRNNFLIRGSTICPMESSGNSLQTPCSVYLQEVQVLHFPVIHGLQMFDIAETVEEQEMPEQNFNDDVGPIESLYESIISCELCLVDDTFKSLPAPILCEDKRLTILNLLLVDILGTMRPHRESACDGIYLDWHLLTEDTCNHEICSDHINRLMKIQKYDIATELQFLGENLVTFDFSFLEDPQEILEISQCEESPKKLTHDLLAKNAPPHVHQKETRKIEQQLQKETTERVSLLFGSMSQSNDLNFFMNARRGVTSKNGETVTKEKNVQEFTPPDTSSNKTASSPSLEVDSPHWIVEEHHVILSDDILNLVDTIQKIYLAILTNETDLRQKQHLFPADNDLELLRFPKLKLMELITSTYPKDEASLPLVALYVIKQLAFFLCYFGIHTAHIYVWKISQANEYLKARLSSIQCLVEDAHKKAEKGLLESHPALLIFEDILRRKPCPNGEKILIVAERLFWLPLNRKLTSMRINFHEVGQSNELMVHTEFPECSFRDSTVGALPHLDCFLVTQENVSEKFPFNEFCSILEYGGPRGSSRICGISGKLVPLPRVHFLKVKLEDHGVLEALCEGSVPQESECMMDVSNKEVVKLINFMPTKDTSYIASSESANKAEAMHDTESASSRPYSNPVAVIIVNTQNSEKKMLISRRSSYQKILSTEKVGVQVVEREIDLPLDIIFSDAVCLVWYDLRNTHITSATTEETSYAARFMETLSTNILMSLSFAFSGCILRFPLCRAYMRSQTACSDALVFEGESTFLAAMMEYSDALYAAAASLDMQLQLFCSYLPESTDEIVLGCINNNIKLHKGLYPAMPESETLAEVFLVKFPSINTLSAHAILSSGCKLGEFLQETMEQRIQAIWKFHIPDESMALFNVLCKYGQLWESKSGTTECSSIDSDVSSGNGELRKRQKCKGTSDSITLPVDDLLDIDRLSKPDMNMLEPWMESQMFQTRSTFGIDEMLNNTFNRKHSNGNKTLSDIWGQNPTGTNSIDLVENGGHKHADENLNGEIVDWNFDFLDEGFQSIANANNASFPKMSGPRTQPMARNSQLGHGYSGTSVASPHLEFNCDDDIWSNSKETHKVEEEDICENDINSKVDILPLKRYRGLAVEKYVHEKTRNILGSPSQQKSARGENPFLSANQSSKLQGGSPWTIDLLNRIKEKNKMHQQSLPCNTCFRGPSVSRNKVKYSPSRSPSTIARYRYRGASKLKSISGQKWQQQVGRPLCTSNNGKKASSAVVPTCTPVDKRARLNLSFARNGHEKQSKLVWINRDLPVADCNLRQGLLDES